MNDAEIVRAAGEQVTGWTWSDEDGGFPEAEGDEGAYDWDPLTFLSDTGILIEAMRAKGWRLFVESSRDEFSVYFWHPKLKCKPRTTCKILSRAITIAALRALEVPNVKAD